MERLIKNWVNKKLFKFSTLFWATLITIFIILLIIGLIGIILSAQLWSASSNNATICNNCEGIVNFVFTNNGTLSPIVNQSLAFNGTSGIVVSLVLPDVITINNLRDLTAYTVDCNGGSEFLTPQAAYNQALLDGKGGNLGDFNAIIIIAPCIYDFGTTQFLINTTNIIFSTLSPVSSVASSVIFSASGPNGGIHVTVSPFLENQYVIFQGITFGLPDDNINGFVLNVTQGNCNLDYCSSAASNFRISLGGEGFTIFSSSESIFRPLPPNDFITTVDANTIIKFQNIEIIEVQTGSIGGHMFNFSNGIGEARIFNLFTVFENFLGIIAGPSSGTSGEGTIQFERSTIIANDGGAFCYFILQSGAFGLEIFTSSITLQGPLIYQASNSISGNTHRLIFENNILNSKNTTIFIEPTVTIIGINNYEISNSRITIQNDQYLINVAAASIGDILNVNLLGTTIQTNGAPLSVYATGPVGISTITLGGSYNINGGNALVGFVANHLTAL